MRSFSYRSRLSVFLNSGIPRSLMPFSGSLSGVGDAIFGGVLTLSAQDWVFSTELFVADTPSLTTCISLNACTAVSNSARPSFSGDMTVLRSGWLETMLSGTRSRWSFVTYYLHISRTF